jgi:hypothetical protein
MRLLTYQMPDELLAIASAGEFDGLMRYTRQTGLHTTAGSRAVHYISPMDTQRYQTWTVFFG